MKRKNIPENHYRASRICRILGNPTAYEILHLLSRKKIRPEEIAKEMGLSLSTISTVLRSLRQLDLIRYVVKWKKRIYWIKENTIITVMQDLEKFVEKIKTKNY